MEMKSETKAERRGVCVRVRGRKDERLLWLPAHSDPPSETVRSQLTEVCVCARCPLKCSRFVLSSASSTQTPLF